MKLIRENIVRSLKKFISIVFLSFFLTPSVLAQHGPAHDTLGRGPASGDSPAMNAETDTATEKSNYFDEIHHSARDTVQLREVPAYVVDSLKKDDAFWYADKSFREKQGKEREMKSSNMPSRWMNFPTLVVIVVIFIGILVWYLLQNNIIRSRREVRSEQDKEETSAENIFDINYQQEIDKALQAANYRFAIRLMFLRLLKQLSQKNIIQYKQERTNFDYLVQLRPGKYYNDFFRLTRNYEFAWYGEFDVSPEQFRVIKNDFEHFDQQLS